MKKLLMIALIFCMLFSVHADGKSSQSAVTFISAVDKSYDLLGTNAYLPIEFENSGSSVTIGFSNAPVEDGDFSDKSGINVPSAQLTPTPNAYSASYGLTQPLYVYWQIISDTKIDLELSARLKDDSTNTNGAMYTATGALMDWYVYDYTQATNLLNTTVSAIGETIDTGHDNTVAIGKSGSKRIYIVTEDLTGVASGSYTGNLVVTIKAGT